MVIKFSIGLNQQLKHTHMHSALQDGFVRSSRWRSVFSFLACWANVLPLPAAPEFILFFPTWGSSRDSKPDCQLRSFFPVRSGLVGQGKYPWGKVLMSSQRMQALGEIPIPVPPLLSLCNPFSSSSLSLSTTSALPQLPKTLQRTGPGGMVGSRQVPRLVSGGGAAVRPGRIRATSQRRILQHLALSVLRLSASGCFLV